MMDKSLDPQSKPRGNARSAVVAALTLATAFFAGGCASQTSSPGPSPDAAKPPAQTKKVLPDQIKDEIRRTLAAGQLKVDDILQGQGNGDYRVLAKNGQIYFDAAGENIRYERRLHLDEPVALPSPTEPGVFLGNPRYYETETYYVPRSEASEFAPAIMSVLAARKDALKADHEKTLARIEEALPHFMLRPEHVDGDTARIEGDRPIAHGDLRIALKRSAGKEGEAPSYYAVVTLRADGRDGELLDSRDLDAATAEKLYRIAASQLALYEKREQFYRNMTADELHHGTLTRGEKDEYIFKSGDFTLTMKYYESFGCSVDVTVKGCPWITGHHDLKARELYETAAFLVRQREK